MRGSEKFQNLRDVIKDCPLYIFQCNYDIPHVAFPALSRISIFLEDHPVCIKEPENLSLGAPGYLNGHSPMESAGLKFDSPFLCFGILLLIYVNNSIY